MISQVSIVIPCYNSELYIKETIDSILSNSCDTIKLEIIAVNDCSNDGTYEILMSYGNALRVINKKINKGVCSARNDGIRAASGEFIALCDHDDVWESDKLLLQIEKFEDPKVGLVCSNANSFDENGILVSSMASERPLFRGNVFRHLLYSNFIIQSSAVVRKDVFTEIGLFDEQIFPSEDLDLWLRIAKKWHIDYVEKVLVHYRVSSTMYSRDKFRMKRSRIPVIDKHAHELNSDSDRKLIMANALSEFAMDYWYDRQMSEFRKKMFEAIRYNILDYKYYTYLILSFLPVRFINYLSGSKNRYK